MGFYDGKGNWCEDGSGFHDAMGNWVEPGGTFYDYKGCVRSYGEGFYDAEGNWCEPGGQFFDGVGYRTYAVGACTAQTTDLVVAGCFICTLPVIIVWLLTITAAAWMAEHLPFVIICFTLFDAVFCFLIQRKRRYRGLKATVSFFGDYLRTYSLLYTALVYALPYALGHKGSFSGFFELTCALAVCAAGIAILHFFKYYHENVVWGLFLDLAYFAAVTAILRYSANGVYTQESLAAFYHVEPSFWFLSFFYLLA